MEGESEIDRLFVEWLAKEGTAAAVPWQSIVAANPTLAERLFNRFEGYCRIVQLFAKNQQVSGKALPHADDGSNLPVEYPIPTGLDALFAALAKRRNRIGRYELAAEVGRGGMGVVRRAVDTELKRPVAIKWLKLRNADTPADVPVRAVSYFIEEAQITGQLDHPGVVPVHELGIDDHGELYFVMKYVEGMSLEEILGRGSDDGNDFGMERLLGVMVRVCETLAYAHERGVVHRDLKPSNIMVGRHGKVFVMDWGLARVLSEQPELDGRTRFVSERRKLRESGPCEDERSVPGIGSLHYMSPEQVSPEPERVRQTSDVYAIGAILYRIVSGIVPYADRNPSTIQEWHAAIASGSATDVADLVKEVRPELVAIIRRAMSLTASARYHDAGELRADLDAYLAGSRVRAYESGADAVYRKLVADSAANALRAPPDELLEKAIRENPQLADGLRRLHSHWKMLTAEIAHYGADISLSSIVPSTSHGGGKEPAEKRPLSGSRTGSGSIKRNRGELPFSDVWMSAAYESRSDADKSLIDFRSLGNGRFENPKLISEDGLSAFYRAYDRELRRDVAIQLMSKCRLVMKQLEVVRLQARLNHKCVPPIFDAAGRVDGSFYFVMPFIDGFSLREWVDRFGQQTTTIYDGVRIVAAAARHLGSIHDSEIVHRNIKPDSIRIGTDAQVWITDWDFASDYREQARDTTSPIGEGSRGLMLEPGSIVGTPAYMSPSAAHGNAATSSDDVFALGSTLYEVISGVRPFNDQDNSRSSREILSLITQGVQPTPIELVAPTTQKSLKRIVAKAMDCDPSRRFRSAYELADSLEGWLRINQRPLWRRWLRG